MKTENDTPSNVQYLPNIEERRKRTQANQQFHKQSKPSGLELDDEAYEALIHLIEDIVDQLETLIRENPELQNDEDIQPIHTAPSAPPSAELNYLSKPFANEKIGITVGGDKIQDNRVINLDGKLYSVGFLKQQLPYFAKNYQPSPQDSTLAIFPWGTSQNLDTGRAFQQYILNLFPEGEPK